MGRTMNRLPRQYVILVSSLIILSTSLLRNGFQSIHQVDILNGISNGISSQSTQVAATQSIPDSTTTTTTTTNIRETQIASFSNLQNTTITKETKSKNFNLTKEATILIQLSGEMANNLMHIAHGLGLKHWAKEEYGIETNIVLRHDTGPNTRAPYPKWKRARDAIQKCFPGLAKMDFTEGNSKDFNSIQAKEMEWLGNERFDHLTGMINSPDPIEIGKGLEYLANEILTDPDRPVSSKTIRLPYMFSQGLDAFPMIDRYYSQIKDVFRFNDTACCSTIPDPDESVFHFRNFMREMVSRRAYDLGFAELSSNKTANELFVDLPNNSKIAVVSRINNSVARDHVNALNASGKIARFIHEEEDVEDFCFMKNTQSGILAGSARSTFVQFAGFLGTASSVILYHLDNPGLRQRHPNFWQRFTYNWTNPELKERIRFKLFTAEELEGH